MRKGISHANAWDSSKMWNGAFRPFRKHHLGTGDIANHVIIQNFEPMSDELQDDDVDTLVYEVTVQFLGSDDTYVFEVESVRDAEESDILDEVLGEITPE